MEGCRRRLIPGSIPTIRKIEPGKQSSKRPHRKVSLVQFYLSFSIVSAMKFSFSGRSILYVYSQTSLRFVNIFSSNSLSLVLFISPRRCILVFYPFCVRMVFTHELWHIRNRTSEISDTKRVCKHRTKHFPCGIMFVIYILRLNTLLKL